MTKLKGICSDCGVVILEPEQVHIYICTNRPVLSTYKFTCECGMVVERGLDESIASAAILAGSKNTSWSIPAEALEVHRDTPISSDEILDFLLELEDDYPTEKL